MPEQHIDPAQTDADSSAAGRELENDEAERLARLERNVTEWLAVPDIASLTRAKLSDVRGMLKHRDLVGVRRGPNRAVYVPAVFVTPEGPRPELKGTFTVLTDGGMSDLELLDWLFTPNETLPVEGAPMDALLAGFKTEVRRRAMETAF